MAAVVATVVEPPGVCVPALWQWRELWHRTRRATIHRHRRSDVSTSAAMQPKSCTAQCARLAIGDTGTWSRSRRSKASRARCREHSRAHLSRGEGVCGATGKDAS
eukprot:scaffold126469_cov90-Phaeocystis_antarctica.AAC.4